MKQIRLNESEESRARQFGMSYMSRTQLPEQIYKMKRLTQLSILVDVCIPYAERAEPGSQFLNNVCIGETTVVHGCTPNMLAAHSHDKRME